MKFIQLFLVALLLLCPLDMLYGYYNTIRLVTMAVVAYMAYMYTEEKKQGVMVMFRVLALLFQPFVKIAIH